MVYTRRVAGTGVPPELNGTLLVVLCAIMILNPIVAILYPIPRIALFPLVLILVGLNETSNLIMIAIGPFFTMLITAMAAVINVEPIYRDVARNFARDEMAPQARHWDEQSVFPVEALRKAAALGFGGIYVKDDVGGSNLSRLDAAIIFEELAKGCTSTAACLPTPTSGVSTSDNTMAFDRTVTVIVSAALSTIVSFTTRRIV